MNNTYRVIEFADAYGIEILSARHFTEEEKAGFAKWYRDFGMYAIVGSRIELPHLTLRDMPRRPADASFPGCENRVWLLTDASTVSMIAPSIT